MEIMMSKCIVVKKVKKLNQEPNFYCFSNENYIKAHSIEDDYILPKPEIGSRYIACRIITSMVMDFQSFNDGWEITTENSIYRFYISTLEEIEKDAQKEGFTKQTNSGIATYWS